MEARRNAQFRAVLDCADLAIPDGIGLLLAGRILRHPLQERVAGVDMVRALASQGARKGWRIFLLGGAPGVAEAAAQVLSAESPGLQIAGAYAGSPAPEQEARIVERIRDASPDVLLVAYGAPRQDLWIARNLPHLGVSLAMGVGGAFDFISGRVPRAPRAMQRIGLEWLYRLWKEPWRWRRMLALPRFAMLVMWSRLRGG
jgi:N-acetylglucosaminyldiphosphoundecaprenol N-acetyl-beta-D-mannosaminyltransferase